MREREGLPLERPRGVSLRGEGDLLRDLANLINDFDLDLPLEESAFDLERLRSRDLDLERVWLRDLDLDRERFLDLVLDLERDRSSDVKAYSSPLVTPPPIAIP